MLSYELAKCNYYQPEEERPMNLTHAQLGQEYFITGIDTDDEELDSFLFTLGCYTGEPITVVSQLRDSYVISVKDGRYNINRDLAEAISI